MTMSFVPHPAMPERCFNAFARPGGWCGFAWFRDGVFTLETPDGDACVTPALDERAALWLYNGGKTR